MRSLIGLFCVAIIVEAETNPGCLKDWSYFTKTNKCFKVFGGKFDSVRPTTWLQAEAYCTTFNGGHLASFHSDDEVTFVVDLTQRALYDDGTGGGLHVGCSYTENNVWEWTDGSHWTYTKWWRNDLLDTYPDWQAQKPRGFLCTQRRWAGTLWTGPDDQSLGFACQMPPSSEG